MSRAAVFIFTLACSAPPPSPGLEAPTVASVACALYDTNPYGACYPQGNSEQIVPNDSYAGADGSFRLAQLYDPEQRFPARLIHIAVLPTWMGPANEEADFITGSDSNGSNTSHVSWASELSPKVVFIVVVPNAAAASGPPITDLQTWMAAHADAIVVSTNPLGSYFDTDAAPLNIDVDPRTMQFLDTTLGFDTNLEQTLETLLASMK